MIFAPSYYVATFGRRAEATHQRWRQPVLPCPARWIQRPNTFISLHSCLTAPVMAATALDFMVVYTPPPAAQGRATAREAGQTDHSSRARNPSVDPPITPGELTPALQTKLPLNQKCHCPSYYCYPTAQPPLRPNPEVHAPRGGQPAASPTCPPARAEGSRPRQHGPRRYPHG